MNKRKYQKYIVNNATFEKELLDVSTWIKEYLTPLSFRCKDRFKNINHPLVLSGRAYWYNENTLCIGYRLKKNRKIYMPVFCTCKDKLLDKTHAHICNASCNCNCKNQTQSVNRNSLDK
jgi:hypothetical protein